ncbi:MAG: hypothetical protein DCF25_06605 [Leptolyngbya foveolarum]|uniref:Uncharacterized protein n=1 Tax=Leptolyngbya foveolarum TaxID=47253 RepID=A0A2W4WDA2_9CYAN|nr:MAG: hypothetical protein DCF25_06605 [Leptolyngbya foveolarum]
MLDSPKTKQKTVILPFGDPRISYRYANDTSSPAEPNLRGADGEQINDDAQSLLVDGEVAITLEVPWSEERGQPEYWTDRELYDAYIESIAGDRTNTDEAD